ncbi:alpha/beta hydrolase [Microbacterium maritypicum]|uniref:alpha/beta hydrolase n=1 Tax=Microbacterium maritypicum TaxID=33918 RepID=UPI0037FD818C
MTFTLNPQIWALLAQGAGPAQPTDFREGDHERLRSILDDGLAQMSALPAHPEVTCDEITVTTSDGHNLRVNWYTWAGEAPGSAVVHFHGGARIAGSIDLYDPLVRTCVAWSGVPVLAVDYRLAPSTDPAAPVVDGLTALTWLREHSVELGVDPARIAVMGDSGGGGVAASVAIAARDASLPLARQILTYPMLDDRVAEPDAELLALPTTFSYTYSRTAWAAVTSTENEAGTPDPRVAPTRTADHRGLAPAFIEIGELDIFRDETVAYASRLWRAGVSAELHVHPGMPHAYDILLLGDEALQAGKLKSMRDL